MLWGQILPRTSRHFPESGCEGKTKVRATKAMDGEDSSLGRFEPCSFPGDHVLVRLLIELCGTDHRSVVADQSVTILSLGLESELHLVLAPIIRRGFIVGLLLRKSQVTEYEERKSSQHHCG